MYNNTTIRVRRCASNAIDTPRLPNADTMAAIAIITTKICGLTVGPNDIKGQITLHINNSNPPVKSPPPVEVKSRNEAICLPTYAAARIASRMRAIVSMNQDVRR